MKWPSCLGSCLGTGYRIPNPESEDLPHSTTAKGPSTPGTLSGILSSFMSKRSCSRGTIDTCGTDLGKRRSLGTRGRGEADVVTLATARYVEFFMGSARNDDLYADIRSVRTGSDLPVSRSSTLTATGRASREASRLATVQYNPQIQHPSLAFGSHRQPASLSVDGPPPQTLSIEPGQQQGQPGQASSHRHASVAVSHGPSLKKKHVHTAHGSRSDRISSSVAACLLPVPSACAIARAHTVLPMMPAASSSLKWSSSMGDLPGPSQHAQPLGSIPATRSQPTFAEAGAGAATAAAVDNKTAAQCLQYSRLSVESCSSHVSVAQVSGRTGQLPQAVGQSDGAAISQVLARPGLAAAAAVGGYRRSTIVYCRNGDVEVTGLPPSCLSSGRTPRRNSSAACDFAPTSGLAPETSAPLLRYHGHLRSAFQRRSMDITSNSPGRLDRVFGGLGGSSDTMPAACLGSRAHATAATRRNSLDSGLVGKHAALASESAALRHDSGTALATVNKPSGKFFLNNDSRLALRQTEDEHSTAQQPMDIPLIGEWAPAQVGVQHGQQCRKSTEVPDKVEPQTAMAFRIAHSSSDGGRGDCCGSSAYVPTRFSDSSQLAPGNNTGAPMTPATVSLVLRGMSERLAPAHAGAAMQTAVVTENPVPSPPVIVDKDQQSHSNANGANGVNQELNMTESPDSFVGFTSGASGLGTGALFTPAAARNVTSALTRLQEACKAAVAQGDLRSHRLSKRMSVDLSSMRLPLLGISLHDSTTGIRRGPLLGGGLARSNAADGGLGMPYARTGSAHATIGVCASAVGNAAEIPAQALGLGSGLGGLPPPHGNNSVHGNNSAWGAAPCDDEPENTIIMDGSMLEGTHVNEIAAIAEEPVHAPNNIEEAEGTGDEAEEYRTRMLKVLLRGDFFHETCDSDGPASEEEDEGVVEYRYGGFGLGGGEGEGADLFRQASFMEAVRRCSTTRISVAAAAAAAAAQKGQARCAGL